MTLLLIPVRSQLYSIWYTSQSFPSTSNPHFRKSVVPHHRYHRHAAYRQHASVEKERLLRSACHNLTTWKTTKVLTLDFGFFQTLSKANLRPYKPKRKGQSTQYWQLPKHPATDTFPASFQALLGMTPWTWCQPDIEIIQTQGQPAGSYDPALHWGFSLSKQDRASQICANIRTGDCPAWLNYYNLWWIIAFFFAAQPPFANSSGTLAIWPFRAA